MMLYEHNDPGFLIRYARTLIEKARQAEDIRSRAAASEQKETHK